MIWKIYKLMAGVLYQRGIRACMGGWSSEQNDSLTHINRLYRIVACIRGYYGLHPAFATATYGDLDHYLKQRLSERDWLLLSELRVVKSGDAPCVGNRVLDVA